MTQAKSPDDDIDTIDEFLDTSYIEKKDIKSAEQIAKGIQSTADAMKAILNSGLKEETIVILIQHQTGLNKSQIQKVLNALKTFDKRFLDTDEFDIDSL